ncbi:MAG: hypothetical protein PHH01_03490 [Patescibacteria group bacterium]|nr:hypothetical protein [Patescibacteria group bacterium]
MDTGSPTAPTAALSVDLQLVGRVTRRYPSKGVNAVKVTPGARIELGDTLLGVTPGNGSSPNSRTVRVTSIELNHVKVEGGEGGQEIGILVGLPLFPIGSSVYRVNLISA